MSRHKLTTFDPPIPIFEFGNPSRLLRFDEARELVNIEFIATFHGGNVEAARGHPGLPRPVGVSQGEQPWWDNDEIDRAHRALAPLGPSCYPARIIEGACGRWNWLGISTVSGRSLEELRELNLDGRMIGSRQDPADEHLWWCMCNTSPLDPCSEV